MDGLAGTDGSKVSRFHAGVAGPVSRRAAGVRRALAGGGRFGERPVWAHHQPGLLFGSGVLRTPWHAAADERLPVTRSDLGSPHPSRHERPL